MPQILACIRYKCLHVPNLLYTCPCSCFPHDSLERLLRALAPRFNGAKVRLIVPFMSATTSQAERLKEAPVPASFASYLDTRPTILCPQANCKPNRSKLVIRSICPANFLLLSIPPTYTTNLPVINAAPPRPSLQPTFILVTGSLDPGPLRSTYFLCNCLNPQEIRIATASLPTWGGPSASLGRGRT